MVFVVEQLDHVNYVLENYKNDNTRFFTESIDCYTRLLALGLTVETITNLNIQDHIEKECVDFSYSLRKILRIEDSKLQGAEGKFFESFYSTVVKLTDRMIKKRVVLLSLKQKYGDEVYVLKSNHFNNYYRLGEYPSLLDRYHFIAEGLFISESINFKILTIDKRKYLKSFRLTGKDIKGQLRNFFYKFQTLSKLRKYDRGIFAYGPLNDWILLPQCDKIPNLQHIIPKVDIVVKASEFSNHFHSTIKNNLNRGCENKKYHEIILEVLISTIKCAKNQTSAKLISKIATLKKKYGLKKIIVSAHDDKELCLIKSYAKNLGIKVFTWQHGSIYYNNRITQHVDFNDMFCSDFLICYGEGAKDAYLKSANGTNTTLLPFGSYKLFNIKQNAKKSQFPKKIDILYVTTNFYNDFWYCGFSPPFNDVEHYNNQNFILNAFKNIHDTQNIDRISVRLPPTNIADKPTPLSKFCVENNFAICESKKDLFYYYGLSKLIVIDYPTTCLLEALCFDSNIILMCHSDILSKCNSQMLKNCGVQISMRSNFVTHLINGIRERQRNDMNDEFVKNFCFNKDSEKSFESIKNLVNAKV